MFYLTLVYRRSVGPSQNPLSEQRDLCRFRLGIPPKHFFKYSSCTRSRPGVEKLFTRKATLEKILKPRAALIGRVNKKVDHVHRCVQFSAKNQVKSKKKVITSANVPFFPKNQAKSQRKGYHVRACLIFHSTSVRSKN